MLLLASRFLGRTNRFLARSFAAHSSSSPPPNPFTVGPYQVFDRRVKQLQKDRAASRDDGERSRTVDYVRDEIADRMIERILVRNYHMQIFIVLTFLFTRT